MVEKVMVMGGSVMKKEVSGDGGLELVFGELLESEREEEAAGVGWFTGGLPARGGGCCYYCR